MASPGKTFVDVEQAQQMMDLYPCATTHHATWNGGPDRKTHVQWSGQMQLDAKKGKRVPYYITISRAVTLDDWIRHLSGTYPLVLRLECDDGTAGVVVLDVDDKAIGAYELQRRVEALELPLFVRKSKSGGIHVTGFLDERVRLEEARQIAAGIARAIDLPDNDDKIVELFPKKRDLNMPYLGKEYGFFDRGSREGDMELPRFLKKVEKLTTEQRLRLISTPKKEKRGRKKSSTTDGVSFAESRLKRYCEELNKLGTGQRNETLFKRCAHLGNMIASGWVDREKVEEAVTAAVQHWENQDKTRDTMERGLEKGLEKEHAPLEEAITHDSVALEFAEKYENELRYDHEVGSWYRWTGTHWQQDRTELAFAWVRDFARDVQRFTVNFCSNVEKFSRTDQRFAVVQEHWDQDHMILGTPGGVVDLLTGELREARPEDMITKLTAVTPSETAYCPTWIKFLNWATDNNESLRDYIKRVAGYCLTGITKEHAMFFNYGTGRNGKGTTVNTIAAIMRDYHRTAPMETFTVSSHDRHPTELAGLRGARLVTATETEESRRWAQSRITQITGGDAVPARFMRQDFFEYTPTYKIWISGNHKPGLRTVNEAIQRRMNLLPWTVTIPEEEKDGDLPKKLEAEWPGILRWMIEGCLEWQRIGLLSPDAVRTATAQYMESEDIIQAWITEKCDKGKSNFASTDELHQSYHGWSQITGEYDGGKRWFAKSLEDRGFARQIRKVDGQARRGHVGLQLKDKRARNAQPDLEV